MSVKTILPSHGARSCPYAKPRQMPVGLRRGFHAAVWRRLPRWRLHVEDSARRISPWLWRRGIGLGIGSAARRRRRLRPTATGLLRLRLPGLYGSMTATTAAATGCATAAATATAATGYGRYGGYDYGGYGYGYENLGFDRISPVQAVKAGKNLKPLRKRTRPRC